jgi:hypothetical protein
VLMALVAGLLSCCPFLTDVLFALELRRS